MPERDPLQELRLDKQLTEAARALAEGRLDAADEAYRAVLAQRPDDAAAWRGLGVLYVQRQAYDEAEHALRRAQELAPENAGIWNDLGEALRLAGKSTDAEAAYQTALKLQPDHAQALNNLGVLLMRSDAERAKSCFLAAIRARPDYAHPYNNLGVLMEGLGQVDEALRCYEAAVVVEPNFTTALENYRDLLTRRPEALGASLARLVKLAEGQAEDGG